MKADEIEVRVGSVSKSGVTMLLYKNARVDMAILDEEFGKFGWQRKHRRDQKGILFCSIGVWDKDFEDWVWKEDCGIESYTEKEKGEASDSFKRAGFCWGIGRELYTAPRIFIKTATKQKQNGRGYELVNPYEFSDMAVSYISTASQYERKWITELRLSKDGEEIYCWVDPDYKVERIESMAKERNVPTSQICDAFKVDSLSGLTDAMYAKAVDMLNKTPIKKEEEKSE